MRITHSGKYWYVFIVQVLKETAYGISGKIQWAYIKGKSSLYAKYYKHILVR